MAVFHDEVEIEDFEYDEELDSYTYPCPCGDQFLITRDELESGEDVATWPSCSLIIRVIYDPDMFMKTESISVVSVSGTAAKEKTIKTWSVKWTWIRAVYVSFWCVSKWIGMREINGGWHWIAFADIRFKALYNIRASTYIHSSVRYPKKSLLQMSIRA